MTTLVVVDGVLHDLESSPELPGFSPVVDEPAHDAERWPADAYASDAPAPDAPA